MNSLLGDFSENLLDRLLNRPFARLRLPAGKTGAVVFDHQPNVPHG